MAELNPTTQCSNSPCLFFYSSGSFNAAPGDGFRQLCDDDRAFFVLNPAEPSSLIARPPALSGAIVAIESQRAPQFRVTTSAATGKLLPAAECP